MGILNKPLVSVIIASYNHADYVRQAIDSVINQSEKNIELIVVDDGSSDGTDKVIEKIKDSRLRLIKLSENRAQHPRNLALRFARGRYIAFQNSDDIWEPNKLELQLKQFKQIKNLSVCFTTVNIVSKTGRALTKSWANGLFVEENQTSAQWLRRFFDIGNGLCISSALMKRSTLKKAGIFDESLIQLSDFDLWIRAVLYGEIYILNKPLTKMRIVKNSNVSAPTPQAHRRSVMELAQILERFTNEKINLYDIFPDIIKTPDLPRQINHAHLANYAWSLSPGHKLFADRLLSDLFSTTKNRNIITAHFGSKIYLDFINRRTQVEIIVHEQTATT